MNLKLLSAKNDLLELEIKEVRPQIKILEVFYDDVWHPWHVFCEPILINEFCEDFEVVKNKIISFYKAETLSSTLSNGTVPRKPGTAILTSTYEEWKLESCRVSECIINEEKKEIILGLTYTAICYKSLMGDDNV